jgi:hypothetical protein
MQTQREMQTPRAYHSLVTFGRGERLMWVRGAVAASVFFIVALWIDGPKVAGDTPFVLDGTNAFTACLSRHELHACGFTGHLNVWGLMSPIGDWPLLQHTPDLIATQLGLSAHPDRVHVLVGLNIAAVIGGLLLARLVFVRMGQPFWFWAFVVVVISGPLLGYTSYSWGETFAAGVLVSFVCVTLLQPHPAFVFIAALGAALTKETSYPFVAVLGILGLVVARRRTGKPIRADVIAGTAGLAIGFTLASLFNIVRFGSVWNTNYLQSQLHTPGAARKLEYIAALFVAPNAGIVFFWPAAVAIVAVACFVPVARRQDARPALVLFGVIAALAIGLASWWTPFGWSAWGPRLTLRWVLPLVILALAAYGDTLAQWLSRVLTKTWRLLLVAATVLVFALPQVGYMWYPRAVSDFFTETRGPCALPHPIGSAQHYACQHHDLWFRTPALAYALRGLRKPGGAITAAVVAVGVLGSLVLVRQDLVGRPRTIPRA